MAQGADDSALDFDTAGGAFERTPGSVSDIAALANGRMHSEFELLGHGDFDLGILAGWAEYSHSFNPALGPNDGELFLRLRGDS